MTMKKNYMVQNLGFSFLFNPPEGNARKTANPACNGNGVQFASKARPGEPKRWSLG
jgi:hypothetical protein